MILHKILFSFLVFFLLISPWARSAPPVPESSGATHEVLPPNEANVGESLYQMPLKFTDQSGQLVQLDVFRGYSVVVSMFYATCPYSCPILLDRLKRFEKSLGDKKEKVRFLLITFDWQNDTPEKLQQVFQKHGLDPARWKFVRGDEGQTREMAALLGINYRKTQDGGFNHSAIVTFLDKRGMIRSQYEVEKFSATEAVRDLEK